MTTGPLPSPPPGPGTERTQDDVSRTALPAAEPGRGPPTAVLRSEDMLRGRRTVDILHAGVRYRLSVTAMGKLILTK